MHAAVANAGVRLVTIKVGMAYLWCQTHLKSRNQWYNLRHLSWSLSNKRILSLMWLLIKVQFPIHWQPEKLRVGSYKWALKLCCHHSSRSIISLKMRGRLKMDTLCTWLKRYLMTMNPQMNPKYLQS
jgi:hypothetical protein